MNPKEFYEFKADEELENHLGQVANEDVLQADKVKKLKIFGTEKEAYPHELLFKNTYQDTDIQLKKVYGIRINKTNRTNVLERLIDQLNKTTNQQYTSMGAQANVSNEALRVATLELRYGPNSLMAGSSITTILGVDEEESELIGQRSIVTDLPKKFDFQTGVYSKSDFIETIPSTKGLKIDFFILFYTRNINLLGQTPENLAVSEGDSFPLYTIRYSLTGNVADPYKTQLITNSEEEIFLYPVKSKKDEFTFFNQRIKAEEIKRIVPLFLYLPLDAIEITETDDQDLQKSLDDIQIPEQGNQAFKLLDSADDVIQEKQANVGVDDDETEDDDPEEEIEVTKQDFSDEDIKELRITLDKTRKDLKQAEQDRDIFFEQSEKLEEELKQKNSQIEELKAESEQKQKFEERANELESELAGLKEQKKKAEKRYDEKIQRLRSENDKLSSDIDDKRSQIEKLEERLQPTTSSTPKLEKEIQQKDEELNKLEQEKERLNNELENNRKELREIIQNNTELGEEIDELRKNLQEARKQRPLQQPVQQQRGALENTQLRGYEKERDFKQLVMNTLPNRNRKTRFTPDFAPSAQLKFNSVESLRVSLSSQYYSADNTSYYIFYVSNKDYMPFRLEQTPNALYQSRGIPVSNELESIEIENYDGTKYNIVNLRYDDGEIMGDDGQAEIRMFLRETADKDITVGGLVVTVQ